MAIFEVYLYESILSAHTITFRTGSSDNIKAESSGNHTSQSISYLKDHSSNRLKQWQSLHYIPPIIDGSKFNSQEHVGKKRFHNRYFTIVSQAA